jgi:hypothetical protein
MARQVLRVLLSLTYDKTTLSTWRAIEAVGRLAQLMGPLEARQAAERLLWMMREESGGNPWSGPELLGEIIRARAGELQDLLPVLASFHEEPIFTEGVLWALGRVAQVAPGLVAPFEPLARMYLASPQAALRGRALLLLRTLGKGAQGPLHCPKEQFVIYHEGALRVLTVEEAARGFDNPSPGA